MKIISIGDIHGRPYWNSIKPENYDKIIFVGDYVDSYYLDNTQIYNNLKEIIEFKKDFPEKVILNLGNHDLPYMWNYDTFPCSGFRGEMYHDLHDLFNDNRRLFQIAYQIDKYIWTHAGISKGWYKYNKVILDEIAVKFETKDLADTLNHMLWLKENQVLNQVGELRGGNLQYGGITWADRKETKNNYLPGYHQIVGHTPLDQITHYGDEKGSIRYIDVLGTYAEIEERINEEIKRYGESNRLDEAKMFTKFYDMVL